VGQILLLIVAGAAFLLAAREFGSQSAASDSGGLPPDVASNDFDFETVAAPVAPAPPRAPVVGLLNEAVSQVMELLGVVDEKTKRLAEAIAAAEGFGVAGAIPTVNHNPGDLKVPGSKMVNGHTFFETDADGWNALYRQIGLWRSGKSRVMGPDWMFAQVAQKYAEDWQPWLENVTRILGVTPKTTLRQYFEG
jgi:hypothetical protein